MTYGRVRVPGHKHIGHGAAVSHSAELVRGNLIPCEGPLIRPFGAPSPQGILLRNGVVHAGTGKVIRREGRAWASR